VVHGDGRYVTVPTDLYRYFDKDDRLLYVGISFHAAARASQHKADKPWWPQSVRMEIEHLPTREAALAAEANAIRTEAPLHNVMGNRGSKATFGTGPVWRCEKCRAGFGFVKQDGFVQLDREDAWHAYCAKCDDGCERYWIDAKRIQTIAHIEEWTEHLCHKNWFDPSEWTHMLEVCCTIPDADIRAYLTFDAFRDRRNRRAANRAS
jgi:hypothetical protein